MNTTNKDIVEISSPCNISFSDNGIFIGEDNEMNIEFSKDENYTFLEKEEKIYELMYMKSYKKNDKDIYDAKINSASFSFDFETQDEILNNKNSAAL